MKKIFTILIMIPFWSFAQQKTTAVPSKQTINKFENAIGQKPYVRCATSSNTNINVCASSLPYSWNGTNYSNEGSFEFHSINANGCDSNAILNLHIINTTTSTTTQTACNNYTWNDSIYTQSGVYTKKFLNTDGCDSIASLVLTIYPFTAGEILGPNSTCSFTGTTGDTAIYTLMNSGATGFSWRLPTGATIISGQGTSVVFVKYSTAFLSGSITVAVTGICGSVINKSMFVSKAVPMMPTAINGPTNVCDFVGTNRLVNYSISPVANAITYEWTLPGTVTLISSSSDKTRITVRFESGYATENKKMIKVKSVSACGNSADRSLAVSTNVPSTPGPIYGADNVCTFITRADDHLYYINKVSSATSYTWTVPAGAVISSHPSGTGANDTIIAVYFTNQFVDLSSISVQCVSACGTSEASSIVLSKKQPVFPGAISGPINVCEFVSTQNTNTAYATYSIRAIDFATSYNWTVPAGASIVSHPGGTGINDTIITVSFDSSFSGVGNIKVAGVNNCGTSGTIALTVIAVKPTTPEYISGAANVCEYVFNGTNATYFIQKVPNATGYIWSLVSDEHATIVSHSGTGVNDTAITIHFDSSFFSTNILVRSTMNCGVSNTKAFFVAKRAPLMPTMSGSNNLCGTRNNPSVVAGTKSQVYSAYAENAASYVWNLPSGTTGVLSDSSRTITVYFPPTYTSGTLHVRAVSVCGTSPLNSMDIVNCAAVNKNVTLSKNTLDHTSALNIYPNPTNGNFIIEINPVDKSEKILVEVVNEFGQSVYQHQEKNRLGVVVFNVNNKLPTGIYMVSYIVKGEKISKRLVVSK